MFTSRKGRRNLPQPSKENLISSGHLANVHRLTDNVVRKVPCDRSSSSSVRAIQTEAWIYQHLGRHKHIARCLEAADDHVDLKFERNGDLEIYLSMHRVSNEFRCRAAEQVVEAVHYIHEEGVVHSDLSARQFLLDEKMNVHLSDFCGSSLNGSKALVIENPSHYLPRGQMLPSTKKSDIFALGSTLYEIMTNQTPYQGKSDTEVQHLYKRKVYPSLDEVQDENWRRIILGCWNSHYQSAREILHDIPFKRKKWYQCCA
ncbi:hypothetical protein DTO166G4_2843 [Paecilomyces variotii]|uniref:Kinase-like domain-containing protein n=1 Tax=Byssochlamys spectabilis TaxID=264951 RepID=A0A443HRV7_BYSSP|nr:kinase-like domain-containing protein [Paecilomyces variotii]KAJ9215473.1 hypothetical protein DTO166G4_2843 [Paecilomyces variotii]KAJ9232224.1 hypothetical protein DTO166G5_6377 [Paecilomyces variotii]KAJ9365495.1 hypothetical protein DTO280E4_464 [Paecilomyces variotii]RWQ94534.1 kinase-like domain-containing protein [Paecilomyces variotii]